MIDCLEKFYYYMIIEWEIFVIMDISLVIYVDSYRYVVWIKKNMYILKKLCKFFISYCVILILLIIFFILW